MYLSDNSTHVDSSYDFLLDLGTVPIACYLLFSILFIHVQYTGIFHENIDRDEGRIQDLWYGGGMSRRGVWVPLKVPSGSKTEHW